MVWFTLPSPPSALIGGWLSNDRSVGVFHREGTTRAGLPSLVPEVARKGEAVKQAPCLVVRPRNQGDSLVHHPEEMVHSPEIPEALE